MVETLLLRKIDGRKLVGARLASEKWFEASGLGGQVEHFPNSCDPSNGFLARAKSQLQHTGIAVGPASSMDNQQPEFLEPSSPLLRVQTESFDSAEQIVSDEV